MWAVAVAHGQHGPSYESCEYSVLHIDCASRKRKRRKLQLESQVESRISLKTMFLIVLLIKSF